MGTKGDLLHQVEVLILLIIVGPPVVGRVRADGAIAVIRAPVDGAILEDARSYRRRARCGIVSDCGILVIVPRSLEL